MAPQAGATGWRHNVPPQDGATGWRHRMAPQVATAEWRHRVGLGIRVREGDIMMVKVMVSYGWPYKSTRQKSYGCSYG